MAARPFISVIIPTYNRPQPLARCLAAIGSVSYPRDRFEVIVVDDGGTARLEGMVRPYCAEFELTLHRQPNQGPAAARNAGAALAQGDLLAFTDDDCMPAPGWLDALATAFVRTPRAALGGKTVNVLTSNPYAAASQLLVDYLYDYFGDGAGAFFTSNNFAVTRNLFEVVGGFDATMPLAAGEDREFCDRWRHAGYLLCWVPEAVVRHAHALTAVSFWQQHFRYGQGAYRYHQVRAERAERPLRVAPFSFYRDLLLYPFANGRGWDAGKQFVLLALSQVANAAGFFYERWR